MESYIDEWHRSRNPVVVAVVGDRPRLPDDPRNPSGTPVETEGQTNELPAGGQVTGDNPGATEGDADAVATPEDDGTTKGVDADNVDTKVVTPKPAGTPRKTQAETK